jgi:isoleucyl-tRNA synthetase
VLDVWLDSAVCSWAQLGYPENETEFNRWWPTNWIVEAHDQTRGWFYSQLGASVIVFDKIPYESVLMHGHALDETGRPMSKSRGTSVDPEVILKQFGVDSFRFYILRQSAPWEDIPFSPDGVKNANRMLNILWNVYSFSTTYMALDNFDHLTVTFDSVKNDLKPEDKWLYSRLEGLKKTVTSELDEFNLHKVCRAIEHFILEDLSRWYVRLIRDRTWIEKSSPAKLSAYRTLYDALVDTAKVMAPITPFISEEIYKNLDGNFLTIHMESWLKPNEDLIDTSLETHMNIIQNLSEGVLSARQKARLKLRWPCKRIIVSADEKDVVDAVNALEQILISQVNTKSVEVIPPGEQWGEFEVEVQPNLSTLGPIFKKDTGTAADQIKNLSPSELQSFFNEGKNYSFKFEGETYELTPELVKLSQQIPEDIIGSDFQGGIVFVDTEITDELKAEGYARELIRRVQDMRKEMDLDVEENIKTVVKLSDELKSLFDNWQEYICTETRSRELIIGAESVEGEFTKEWDVEGENFEIGISKLNN